MRAFWVFVILGSLIVGWFGAESVKSPSQNQIVDISWPNCDVYVTPAEQGIVGINGGLAFRTNPCLASEISNFKRPSVYLNTGYPGTHIAFAKQQSPKACMGNDKKCRAYNYGYNSGRYAFDYSIKSGVLARFWWLDVETENSWDKDPLVNRSNLQGTFDAISKIVGKENVGFYSYPGQWDKLTASWHNQKPAWVATGSTKATDAQKACHSKSFTGGVIRLSQYTPSLDQNIICSTY